MRVALAQLAPVLLDRAGTLEKVVAAVDEAAAAGAALVAFGEALVPGYPAWIARTDGARFDAADQKELHAAHLEAAVRVDAGDLDAVGDAAARGGTCVVLGVAERVGHTLHASCVTFAADGDLVAVHRKLVPTHEERLAWGPGDGAGLVVHRVGPFTVGALNCWENWMPLARAALHAQGEDLHVSIWPGSDALTREVTRFAAREGRSYVVAASGLLRADDVPPDFPHRDRFVTDGETLQNGGSCVAGPDGGWVLEPVVDREGVVVVDLDPARVREERQNFDAAGHYARPDVLQLAVDRTRRAAARFRD